MDLPDEKGTYVLILHVAELKRMEIGRLGAFDIRPGFYAYVGSAFGAGGLRARLGRHIESVAAPHWHIDYLMAFATPTRCSSQSCRSASGVACRRAAHLLGDGQAGNSCFHGARG